MISIDKEIEELLPNCRLGYNVIRNVTVKGTPSSLALEFQQIQAEIAQLYNINTLTTVPRILAVRTMFKKLTCDPSRYRPASEAMVRRVLQRKELYYVNSAVDVNNYCSLKYLLPFGIYDFDNIQGNIVYGISNEGTYENIAGNMVSTQGKPFLTDDRGVFGNPTSDSRRTAVKLSTKNLVSVVYADEEVRNEELSSVLDFSAKMFMRYSGGQLTDQNIIHV